MSRRTPAPITLGLTLALCAAGGLAGCDDERPQGDDYYTRVIQPILDASCSGATSGCHRADPADPFAQAAGNLDTTSFDNVHKRPDLLRTYGAYPVPVFLIKAVGGTDELQIAYNDQAFFPIEILHNGGPILAVGSPQFVTLQRWLENGATRTGLPPPPEPVEGQGDCSTAVPPDFDPGSVDTTAEWMMLNGEFDDVLDVLRSEGCDAKNCHGAPQSDFYITCGDDDLQKKFNFRQVWAFVATPPADSEILRRPLSPTLGGLSHAGGIKWDDGLSDAGYQEILAFATMAGTLDFGEGDPGKEFFADQVMPVLLKRGCATEGCHSPGAMNDLKLRPGSAGFVSAVALEKNYDLLKREFMALEVPDPRRGRAVAKAILPAQGGIAHRAGPVLETPGAGFSEPANCAQPYDPMTASAFCTVVEWVRIERQALIATGEIDALGAGATVPIVYVERAANHVADPLAFDSFQGGSDLLVADATIDASGAITGVAGTRSLAAGCAGYTAGADVRSPDVNGDGVRVTFAMRLSAADTLGVWTVNIDGSNCQRITPAGAHYFDPAWSPDHAKIVYASNKAGGTSKAGRPQADLFRADPDGSDEEQLTWLSNTEMQPAFMREGRLTMVTEKGDPAGGFYQLSGRRLNWDITDYHPLLAQRADSPLADMQNPAATLPSVGYAQATEIREGLNGNFLVVLSDVGARGGGGTLGVFNRSIGPNEVGRTDESFLESLTIPDPAATGRVGGMTSGAYRSPFPLLDGRIMASYAGGSFDLGSVGSLDFDIVAVDPRTGARQLIIGGPGAQVEAVLALKVPVRKMYLNRRQLVFGGEQNLAITGDLNHAVVHFPDLPLLATLLNANLRRGRPVEIYRAADTVAVVDAAGNEVGSAPLASDGSARIKVPAMTPVFLRLKQGSQVLFTMTEEHQYGPGEVISMGIVEPLFDHVCGGCHGSVSGRELDVSVVPDALTGASQSQSATATPVQIGP